MTNEWQSSAADSVDKQSQCGNNENAQKHKSVQMCDLKKKKVWCKPWKILFLYMNDTSV